MKKKFIITEEQAQKILRLDELTQNQQSQQSTQDPCDTFTATMAPSQEPWWIQLQQEHGDIDCCRMLNGDFGPVFPGNGTAPTTMLQTHCDVAWSQAYLGYGTFAQGNILGGTNLWAECCDPNINTNEPCPHGTVIVGATPQDPNEGHCMECFAGTAAGPNNAHNPTMAAITGWNCECCEKDSHTNTSRKCERCDDPSEFRLNGACTKCIEDLPNNPGCCKKDGHTNTGNGEGCSDDVCPNPNHVKTPYNPNGSGCKCECPGGELRCPKGKTWDSEGCKCVSTSQSGRPIKEGNRRITRGKLPQAPRAPRRIN